MEMTPWDTIVQQHWIGLFASISEINARFADKEEVLHADEIDVFANIRSKSYRESWFAGRMLAKQCYVQQSVLVQQIDWKEILIVSRNSSGKSIAPRLFVGETDTGFVFSLSHVADKVAVVVPADSADRIGCDLVYRNTATQGIAKTFFHDDEVNDHQNFDSIWAVKEAAYKSCNSNDSFQPLQWRTENIGENRYFCRHTAGDRQLSAEVETLILGDYTLAVARKSSVCYTVGAFSG